MIRRPAQSAPSAHSTAGRAAAGLAALALTLTAGGAFAQASTPASTAPAAAAPAAADDPGALAAQKVIQAAFPNAHTPMISGKRAYLTISAANGRTQNVFVSDGVFGPASARIRVVSSYAATYNGPLDQALANRLLSENSVKLNYGYWALSAPGADGRVTLTMLVELRADAAPATLAEVMGYVAQTADALELELTGKDVY